MNATTLRCDTCDHTTTATEPNPAEDAAHEAAAGAPASTWGDRHILWPTHNGA